MSDKTFYRSQKHYLKGLSLTKVISGFLKVLNSQHENEKCHKVLLMLNCKGSLIVGLDNFA
jgi:hypothetical protein